MGDLLIHVGVIRLQEAQGAPPDPIHVLLAFLSLAQHVEQVVRVRTEPMHPALFLVGVFPALDVLLKLRNQDCREDVGEEVVKLAPLSPALRQGPSKATDDVGPNVLGHGILVVRFAHEENVVRLRQVSGDTHEQVRFACACFTQDQDALGVRLAFRRLRAG